MEILIEKYKNINKLNLIIEDNKVNHIFGISGSGKSSIASALAKEVSEENVMVGYKKENVIVKLNGKDVDNTQFGLFDLDISKNIIFSNEENQDIYEVLFSEDGDLVEAKNELENLMKDFYSLRDVLISYNNKIELVVKHFDIKINNDGTLSKRSKLYKLEDDLFNNEGSSVLKNLRKNDENYIKWLQDGEVYKKEKNRCPYCNSKMSLRKLAFIDKVTRLTPKNFEIITKENNYLEDVGIKKPKYTNIREVNRAKKEIIELYEFSEYIKNIIYLFEEYKSNELDISKISKIKLSPKFLQLFPEQYENVEKINNSINLIRKMIIKVKSKTNDTIQKNKKIINGYLKNMGIPYKFYENHYNFELKKASFLLQHIDDKTHTDRRQGLSYGEKNIISLILFLISSKKQILLIDDPASSYDEYRRECMINMIYNFQKNRTIILFSHDQVFIKFAVLLKYKEKHKIKISKADIEKKNNTGKIYHFCNYNGECKFLEISDEDFGDLEEQTLNNIKDKELSYYRKIINLRLLCELNKNKNKSKYRDIYMYCSAILHFKKKEDIYKELQLREMDEDLILNKIKSLFNIELQKLPDDYLIDFLEKDLSNFEKIFYYREKNKSSIYKIEFDNIVHLNDRLFVSLNPYKFDYFSNNVYELINNK